MKRTSVFLTEQQIKALASLSKSTGLPASEYIRRAVDDLLKKQNRAKQGVISSEHSTEDIPGKQD
jgi:Arc/MetJ-type ribon-helix-helix transcriptional regulator